MNDKNQFWREIVTHMEPKPICPFDVSSIKIMNFTMDLGFAARLPLDGYTWITSIKLYKPIAHVRHRKHLLFCFIAEATITKQRPTQRHT